MSFPPLHSQSANNKWTFALDLASIPYLIKDGRTIASSLLNQSPRFSIAKYMSYNITFVGSFSTVIGGNMKYTTFDGLVRYDFGTSQNSLVPYVFIGGSLINASSLTPTTNFGIGNTYWFSGKYGFNSQIMYKDSQVKFTSQKSHFMISVGFVYSFGFRSMQPRMWEH
ncbi:hypothetical protein [Polaribacter sp. SA4-10]|uniref:hypothetical protein n=1 Tax=Polaribacter sp. SA4-10 TaxID=754397 RepID=UPI0012FC08C3|nr:hypothetical protein [Polaribacter sp. SA4-10]